MTHLLLAFVSQAPPDVRVPLGLDYGALHAELRDADGASRRYSLSTGEARGARFRGAVPLLGGSELALPREESDLRSDGVLGAEDLRGWCLYLSEDGTAHMRRGASDEAGRAEWLGPLPVEVALTSEGPVGASLRMRQGRATVALVFGQRFSRVSPAVSGHRTGRDEEGMETVVVGDAMLSTREAGLKWRALAAFGAVVDPSLRGIAGVLGWGSLGVRRAVLDLASRRLYLPARDPEAEALVALGRLCGVKLERGPGGPRVASGSRLVARVAGWGVESIGGEAVEDLLRWARPGGDPARVSRAAHWRPGGTELVAVSGREAKTLTIKGELGAKPREQE